MLYIKKLYKNINVINNMLLIKKLYKNINVINNNSFI